MTEIALINAERCREAAVTLAPDQSAFTYPLPDQIAAFWDESSGWSLIVHRADIETEYYEGTQVLPEPDVVSAWVALVLTLPALELARDQVRFRNKDVADPAFDAKLATYSTSHKPDCSPPGAPAARAWLWVRSPVSGQTRREPPTSLGSPTSKSPEFSG